jgi:hypothetical protein
LIGKIKDKEGVRRIIVEPSVWVYKFGKNDGAVYVMWYDNPLGGSKEVRIPFPWKNVLITHVISEPSVTEPVTEIKSTQDRVLQITLDSSPVFVEKYLEVGTPIY